jgi:hypothetical protein
MKSKRIVGEKALTFMVGETLGDEGSVSSYRQGADYSAEDTME